MKNKFLRLFTVLLVLLVAITVVACSDYEDPIDPSQAEESISRTQVVSNGTFYNATSSTADSYVKENISGWTATSGSLKTSASGVTMGVIDLSKQDVYNAQINNFSVTDNTSFTNPGVDPKTPFDTDDEGNEISDLQDNNALVIASNLEAGSLYYASNVNITLKAGKYYLLQYSVASLVDLNGVDNADKPNKGAWVRVTGGVEYTDSCINTDGKWETRYLYIEANKDADKTIKIQLWLGHGPTIVNDVSNSYITKGAAMFDNIICSEVTTATDSTFDSGNATTLNRKNFDLMAINAIAENSSIGYESMYYMSDLKLEQYNEATPTTSAAKNYFYSFREGSYSSDNVTNYSVVKGKSDLGDDTSPSYQAATSGIVNLSKLYNESDKEKDTYSRLLSTSYTFKAPTYDEWKNYLVGDSGNRTMSALDETKALMIYHKDLSGAGFTSKSSLTIEKDAYYEISVWVYVWLPVDTNGDIILPSTDKPSEPNSFTVKQKAYNSVYLASNTVENPLEGYFELSDEEKLILADNATAPESVTPVDDINVLIADADFLALVKSWLSTNGLIGENADRYDNSEAAMNNIASKFVYRYLREEGNAAIVSGDSDYIEYKAVEEESNLLKNSDWTGTLALVEKWESYDEDLNAWSAKYNTWKSANDYNSAATVKLTGAGVEKKEETTICNKGYQADKGWEKISFYVQGNQLSSRNLTLEFWFGEGSATEYESLMMGGAIFDNISILEISEDVALSPLYVNKWETLSPITEAEQLALGNLNSASAVSDNWKAEAEENVAAIDINRVKLTKVANSVVNQTAAEDQKLIEKIKIDGTDVNLYSLILENEVPTASKLSMLTDSADKYLTIKPNTAYRLAVWVRTEGIDSKLGANIDLFGGKDKDSLEVIASVTTFNNEEWQEIAFYILGDVVDINIVNLKVILGSGTRFSTESYIEGKLYASLINYSEIEYSEYNSSSKSGNEIKEYQFNSTAAASSSVTNGNFSEIKYTDTDEEEFDDEGKLTGVGATSSWTALTTKTNTYNKVDNLSYVGVSGTTYELNWSGVKGIDKDGNDTKPASYEIYARFNEESSGKTKTVERLCGIISAEEVASANYDAGTKKFKFNVEMAGKARTSFRVKAVSDTAVSLFSSYVALPRDGDNAFITKEDSELLSAKKFKAGTVNNENLFSGAETDYISPYKTALKIFSNYDIAYGLKSSSSSLTANSYYIVSVWVKTLGDAKASVTVSNVSNVLTSSSSEKYVGFSGINTAGKWTQYRFYIKTGAASGSLELELSLGNPYASKVSQTVDSSTVFVYDTQALSKGTVYFDSVKVYNIDEVEYSHAQENGEYNQDKTDKLHNFEYLYAADKNQYAMRILEGTTDSFDAFTESTDNSETFYETKSYTWAKAANATGTTLSERVHGVYNYNKDTTERLEDIYTIEGAEDEDAYNAFEDFMPENFDIREFLKIDGYNSLVMSNKVPYGQSYTLGENVNVEANSYYKLTFKAKTLIAKEEIVSGEKTYTTEGVNAEFRYMQTSDTSIYQSIFINSNRAENVYDAVTYEMYIYNPSSASKSVQWAFYLGDKEEDDEDDSGAKQLIIGMMVIDQVSLTKVDETTFGAYSNTYNALTDAEKVNSASRVYAYSEDEEPAPPEEEPAPPEEEEKPSIWDRGDAWLLISSIVIAIVIVIVIVIVLIRRWQKKHPREVKGENIAKTEKEIKVVAPIINKEDILESDEYSDEVEKPKYVQRVVRKDKKKKK